MTPNTIKLSILGLLSRTFGQDFDPDEETFAALAWTLLSGGASAVPLGWRDMVPDWYVRAVAEMVGGEQP